MHAWFVVSDRRFRPAYPILRQQTACQPQQVAERRLQLHPAPGPRRGEFRSPVPTSAAGRRCGRQPDLARSRGSVVTSSNTPARRCRGRSRPGRHLQADGSRTRLRLDSSMPRASPRTSPARPRIPRSSPRSRPYSNRSGSVSQQRHRTTRMATMDMRPARTAAGVRGGLRAVGHAHVDAALDRLLELARPAAVRPRRGSTTTSTSACAASSPISRAAARAASGRGRPAVDAAPSLDAELVRASWPALTRPRQGVIEAGRSVSAPGGRKQPHRWRPARGDRLTDPRG